MGVERALRSAPCTYAARGHRDCKSWFARSYACFIIALVIVGLVVALVGRTDMHIAEASAFLATVALGRFIVPSPDAPFAEGLGGDDETEAMPS